MVAPFGRVYQIVEENGTAKAVPCPEPRTRNPKPTNLAPPARAALYALSTHI